MHIPILIILVLVAPALPALASAQSELAYEDPVARELVAAARHSRTELGRSILSYTAVVRRRSAAMLRMPMRDRLLAHSESAARVRWSREGEHIVQLLGARVREMDEDVQAGWNSGSRIFDPTADRIFLGRMGNTRREGSEEPWIAHPLAEGAESNYRFRSGDTVRVHLPGGRTIEAVELRVIPRQPSFRYMAANLLIEPGSGALIEAVFRPARNLDLARDFPDSDEVDFLRFLPGFFKPVEVDLDRVVIQYSLWELEHWLPRQMRIDGYVRAGTVRVPFSDEISYQIEQVEDQPSGAPRPSAEEILASWGASEEWRFQRFREESPRPLVMARPRDVATLTTSDELPPPIWEAAPEFASGAELRALAERLERTVPRSAVPLPIRTRLAWGLGAGTDNLIRYNRVEGLSLGLRGIVEHPVGIGSATVRLGTADLTPNLELALDRPGRERSVGVGAFHRLTSAADADRPFGPGNSLSALIFGRDEGEYYRTTGASLTVASRSGSAARLRMTFSAERQRPVEADTDLSLARLLGRAEEGFRPNLQADAAELAGASLAVSSWWGIDPARVRAGAELFGEAATGSHTFARARATSSLIVPAGRQRLGLEIGGGTAWGTVPAQYHWFLGGSQTVRGYEPSSRVGRSFARGRGEIARGPGRVTLAVFGDGGWAGEPAEFDLDHALLSAGVGMSILDGALRLDLARALRHSRGWTLGIYLDGLL